MVTLSRATQRQSIRVVRSLSPLPMAQFTLFTRAMSTMPPSFPDAMVHDIAIVLGTRPEIIKLAGIIRHLADRARVIYTGQHYDRAMYEQFLFELGLHEPDV